MTSSGDDDSSRALLVVIAVCVIFAVCFAITLTMCLQRKAAARKKPVLVVRQGKSDIEAVSTTIATNVHAQSIREDLELDSIAEEEGEEQTTEVEREIARELRMAEEAEMEIQAMQMARDIPLLDYEIQSAMSTEVGVGDLTHAGAGTEVGNSTALDTTGAVRLGLEDAEEDVVDAQAKAAAAAAAARVKKNMERMRGLVALDEAHHEHKGKGCQLHKALLAKVAVEKYCLKGRPHSAARGSLALAPKALA